LSRLEAWNFGDTSSLEGGGNTGVSREGVAPIFAWRHGLIPMADPEGKIGTEGSIGN